MSNEPQSSTPDPRTHVDEAPLDPANQSLADALKTSFRILKGIMFLLAAMFLFSGVFIVQENEAAVVLRLGRQLPGVRMPGVHFAWPYPVDEVVRLPIQQSTTLTIDSQWFHVRADEEGQSLDYINRGVAGLDPTMDGALLTGDHGLVHVRWEVSYRIADLEQYLRRVADADVQAATRLLTNVLESTAVRIAAGFAAEDIIQKRIGDFANRVKIAVNNQLETLGCGIMVESVSIPQSTPPIQTRPSFQRVTTAQNDKQKTIRDARQEATALLSQTAGSVAEELVGRLDALSAAQRDGDEKLAAALRSEIDDLLETRASGDAGVSIGGAKSFYARTVHGLQSDMEQYHALRDEYERNPRLLVARMWDATYRRILSNTGVTKWYLPQGEKEVRLVIGPDPEQRKLDEMAKYQKEQEDQGVLLPELRTPMVVFDDEGRQVTGRR